MTQRPKTARSRAARPTLEGLEARALLSDMSTAHAEVSALRAHPTSQSILQNLTPLLTATTVAANGDNNPYGVAFIPKDFPAGGKLKPGDILVSDFNNGTSGLQATGVSIVSIDPAGNTTTFFQGLPGLGLNTALGVLPGGFIIVGNTPRTTDANGTPTVASGSLLILDRNGQVVETLDATNPLYKLDGPWGLTIVNQGSTSHVFVSNVLNGTVTRIDMTNLRHGKPPKFMGATEVASGYTFGTNAAALVVGPQGLAFDARRHVLYVASTADNAIFTVLHPLRATSSSGTGAVFAQNDGNLNGPLSLALASNGHLLVTNGDAILSSAPPPPFNLILEYQPPRGRATMGTFVAQLPIDNTGIAGGAFGLAIGSTRNHHQILAAVDDNSNSLIEWTIKKIK